MTLRPPRPGPGRDDATRTTVVDETAALPPAVEEEEVVLPRRPPPPLLWPWLLLLLLLVIGGLLAAYFLTRDSGNGKAAGSVSVPRVVGLQQDDAVARLHDRGLGSNVLSRPSTFPRGTVFAQRPAAGTTVARHSQVRLSVSAVAVAPVPNVVGMQSQAAVARLQAAGLKPQPRNFASLRPRGTVVSQAPGAGRRVGKDSTVALRVSTGAVTVPDVVGQAAAKAKATLAAAGLSAAVFEVPSADPKGTVEAQRPTAGQKVARGSNVRINVSDGSQATPGGTTTPGTGPSGTTPTGTPSAAPVTAPKVVGLQQSVSQRRVQAAGLRAQVVYVSSSAPSGQVLSERPIAGTKARRGSKERLTASTGPAAATNPVPGVKRRRRQAATQTLQAAGFTVQVLTVPVTDPSIDGLVVDEQPAGGIRAPSGSSVTIYVGRVRR